MKLQVLVLLFVLAASATAQQITVAAAADLHSAMQEISTRFEQEKSVKVNVVYGASGNFYQQIQNGAPFDLFFSANSEYPKKLETDGLTLPATYYEYAQGKIVLLVLSSSTLNLGEGLKVLLGPAVRKIAIADPAHAPYGRAAVAALKSQNLYERVAPKLVTGENISQAASFVISGAADIGIIAKSLAVLPSSRSQTRFVEIPQDEYPPIMQACVVLRSSKQQKLARQFESYIKSSEAAKILKKYGFELPPAAQQKSVP